MDIDVSSQALNGHSSLEDEPMLVADNDASSTKGDKPPPSSTLYRYHRSPIPRHPVENELAPPTGNPQNIYLTSNRHSPPYLTKCPRLRQTRPPTPHITQHTMPISAHVPESVPEKQPVTTLSQSLTSAAASDILVQVPYSQSSLSSVPEWHLPTLPSLSSSHTRQVPLPTPQVEQSLLTAYHYILTHPPPTELPPLNPSRHKVAWL